MRFNQQAKRVRFSTHRYCVTQCVRQTKLSWVNDEDANSVRLIQIKKWDEHRQEGKWRKWLNRELLLDNWPFCRNRKSLDFYDNGRDNVQAGRISEGVLQKRCLFFLRTLAKKDVFEFMVRKNLSDFFQTLGLLQHAKYSNFPNITTEIVFYLIFASYRRQLEIFLMLLDLVLYKIRRFSFLELRVKINKSSRPD